MFEYLQGANIQTFKDNRALFTKFLNIKYFPFHTKQDKGKPILFYKYFKSIYNFQS